MALLVKIAKFIQRVFYTFLDISGILLGVFLTILGWWVIGGNSVSFNVGGIILFLGIVTFLIHAGHYFSWKLTRWIFGSSDYFLTRGDAGAGVDNENPTK